MGFRMQSAMLAVSVVGLSAIGAAQTGQPGPIAINTAQSNSSDVTFTVPLNFTHLSSDLAKIAVSCKIESTALPKKTAGIGVPMVGNQQEYPVTGGQLVMTANVVVPVSNLVDPTGKTASYTCEVSGFSTQAQQWGKFDPQQTILALRLSPAPPSTLSGSFTW